MSGDRVISVAGRLGIGPMTCLLDRCVRCFRPATRPGLAPADEFLLLDDKRNQKRLSNVHPCLRTPSLSTRCVHHSGVLNTPNRRSADWHVSRPGKRKRAPAGDGRQASVSLRVKDAASVRMPGGGQCQSGDRRFGVLRTPERRTHRVGSLCVRRRGWTFKRRFWFLLSSNKRDSSAGTRPGRVAVGNAEISEQAQQAKTTDQVSAGRRSATCKRSGSRGISRS